MRNATKNLNGSGTAASVPPLRKGFREMEKKMASKISEMLTQYKNIEIPPYQRAYGWGEDQWKQFFDDLVEQKDNRTYYLGQFIFEKENDSSPFYVIDGQQRITTVALFFATVIEKFAKNNVEKKLIDIYTRYLSAIKPIEIDRPVFSKIIFDKLRKLDDPETASQGLMVKAANYFQKRLEKIDIETVKKIACVLKNAFITVVPVKDRLLATQIFEYQNNRGKDLSDFEIIKAYLLQVVYTCSENRQKADMLVDDLQNSYISRTFRYIESIEGYFTESELLNSTCYLFCDGNSSGDLESIKDILKNVKSNDDKIVWIKNFFKGFADIAFSGKNIVAVAEKEDGEFVQNLFLLGNRVNWKLVLLSIYNKNENDTDFYQKIVKALNVLNFKMCLTNYSADYLADYVWYYYNIDGETPDYNIGNMYEDIKNAAINGFKWYWNAESQFVRIIKDYFEKDKAHYYNRNMAKFILWTYENSLRKSEKSGLLMDKDMYAKYTIEHIHPENPEKEDTEFFQNNYLHIIGNLNLLTQSQNSRFGRKDFDKKKELYQNTALISYTKIRECDEWTKTEILVRSKEIGGFIIEYFHEML